MRNVVLTNRLLQKQQSSIDAYESSARPPEGARLKTRTNSEKLNETSSKAKEASKEFQRSSSNPEALSKDEARRRMLSWRKTTKIRKSDKRRSGNSNINGNGNDKINGNGNSEEKETNVDSSKLPVEE